MSVAKNPRTLDPPELFKPFSRRDVVVRKLESIVLVRASRGFFAALKNDSILE
jgi:hypothetical protein